jgi:hypothetical protein
MSQREVQNDLSSLILSYQFYVVQELRAAINKLNLLFFIFYILLFSVSGFMELRAKSTPWTLEQSI